MPIQADRSFSLHPLHLLNFRGQEKMWNKTSSVNISRFGPLAHGENLSLADVFPSKLISFVFSALVDLAGLKIQIFGTFGPRDDV